MNFYSYQKSRYRTVSYVLFLAGLMCLGAVTPALAQHNTSTVLTLTNSTYPTNGYILVRVTDTDMNPGVPTGTATVIINGNPQTVNLNPETAITAIGTTQIVSQAGSYTITSSYNPTSNHSPSIDPVQLLTIAKATLTITANPVTITYGQSPTFTTTIAGYVNTDTAPVLGAAGSQGTTQHSAPQLNNNPTAGSWTITPAVGNLSTTNYAYTVVTGNLTVNPATLTVTANSPGNMVYGTAAPSLSATVTGQVNNDQVGYSGTALVNTNATSSSGANVQNVGNWVTTAGQNSLSSNNYNFTYVAGSYSVSKALLTVTPNSVSASYGSTPSYTPVITGYVSGDNSNNSIAGNPTYNLSNATFTNSLPNTGNWPIVAVVTGLSSSNYNFVAGSNAPLVVTQVTLTVSAATPAPIVYGNQTPTFTPSYSGFVNNDTAGTALTGAPAYTTDATLSRGNPIAGPWSSRPAQGNLTANNGNYVFAYANGSFTVNQAVLALKANDPSPILYGTDFPQFTATISGYVNGDTSFTAYTGTPAVANVNATTTNGHPNAGSWTITPETGTLASLNYTFNPVVGTAIVTKVGLTVTANPLSIIYGASPSFTTTVTGYVNGDQAPVVGASGSIQTNSNATLTNGKPNAGAWVITPSVTNVSATNYSYAVAPGTLTVATASLTLTATAQTVGYGTSPDLTGSSGASVTVTGLVNGDTGTPALTTNATTTLGLLPNATNGTPWIITVAAGTIPVSNYTVTLNNGTLTVNPMAITITALLQTVTYGTAFNATPGAGTVSMSPGLVFGESGVPTLSSSVTLATGSGFPNSGTWTITPAAGTISATNYTITLTAGTFQVNQAPLVISAAPASITYGAVAPSFSPTYSGFVTGDNAGNIQLNGAATFQDNATTTNSKPNAGSWNISSAVNTLVAPNYTFSASVANTAFTVNKAPITVTAQPAGPITYGNAFPTFTATFGTFVNSDTDGVVRGVPLFTTNATTTNQNPNFGTWTITPVLNSLAADNYIFTTFATGSFSVTKAPLTVNANSFQPISYGSPAPTFSYTVTGFVIPDTQAVVTGTAGLSSNATLRARNKITVSY